MASPPATLASDYDQLEPLAAHRQVAVAIVDRLRHHHLLRDRPLDDAASGRIFDNYIEFLDPKRVLFLADDIAEVEKYRTQLDDALEQGDLAPAFEIYNVYRRRELDRIAYELALLQRGIEQFDFALEEAIELDRNDAPPPAAKADAENLWRLGLKSRVLAGKLADEPFDALAETLTKRIKNRLRSIRQTRSEDVFQAYINAFTRTYDRHTQYFSPQDSEDFKIYMSLSLEGIGAVLGIEDEYTVVQRLVKGGPADLGGKLKPSDRIVAVSQSANEPFVDIVGWRTSEVVQLIRGPKGSPVLLEVMPVGVESGETRVVEIVRNVVELEEQSARKSLLTLNRGGREHRIGVVVVPTFYLDFEAMQAGKPDHRSTSRDVARLIGELKAEGMDALIMDLRNNGGGSLQEAVDLTGLFIETGPVVQVTSPGRPPFIYSDRDESMVWDGPLAVMVNRLSASASEIFASAIQDYGLGVVVGGRTFGKGTVQTLVPLPRAAELKLTERQFNRVTGERTESNGVSPDIAYPTPEGRLANHDLPSARGYDALASAAPPAKFAARDEIVPVLANLRRRHEERTSADPDFDYLRAREQYIERLQQRTSLSLREETRRDEKQADDAWLLDIENARLLAKGDEPSATLDELYERRQAEADDEPNPEDDALVRETASILIDFIGLSRPLAMTDASPRQAVQ